MNLDQWDKEIAPKLQEIELSSGWISFYARKIGQAAATLYRMPAFDLEAMDALDRARIELQRADDQLRATRDEIARKDKVT